MDRTNLLKPIGAIVLIVIIAAVIIAIPKKSVGPVDANVIDTTAVPVATKETVGVTTVTSTTTVNTVKTASKYKNGTYSASGTYRSPEGQESVNVSITLSDGVIEDSTVIGNARDGKSLRYQGIFIANYKTLITGKNIDDVRLSKVSGSSLTSAGFNAALEKIKIEAKA